MLDDLCDIHKRNASGTFFDGGGKEHGCEVGLSCGKTFCRWMLSATLENCDIESIFRIDTFLLCNVVTGELGLRNPMWQKGYFLEVSVICAGRCDKTEQGEQ